MAGRQHLLPQALGVVHDLKIAAGGKGPPHRPAEQRARGVAHQKVIPQHLQHEQSVGLGFLHSERGESTNIVKATAQRTTDRLSFLCDRLHALLVKTHVYKLGNYIYPLGEKPSFSYNVCCNCSVNISTALCNNLAKEVVCKTKVERRSDCMLEPKGDDSPQLPTAASSFKNQQ